MFHHLLRALLYAVVLVPAARADFLTGHVVDANGVGVPGVDIDVKSLTGGGTPVIFNDGTDINGFFFTTIPAGIYRVIYKPPPPPVSTHLVLRVEDVVIVGTTDVGNQVLTPGVALSARTVNSVGVPVANVNLDIVDATGNNLALPNDMSDAFGNLLVAAPIGTSELRFNTLGVIGPTLAHHAMDVTLAIDTNLGDITLPPGLLLSAHITGPGGLPLEGIDTDVHDALTQAKLYTPGDNTDLLGNITVVVPAGTYDLKVCPKVIDLLVAAELPSVVVAADMSVGTIPLQAGSVLSGTVTALATGLPVAGVDVDVTDSVSGLQVPLCADNTNGVGGYAVIVPPGTYNVEFEPSYSQPLGTHVVTGVSVVGPAVAHGSLPSCPFAIQYGTGLAGLGGFVPLLDSSGGAPRLGNPNWTLELSNALGGELATLLIGVAPAQLPFKHGTLLVHPGQWHVFLPIPLSGPPGVAGAGAFSLPLIPPDDPLFAGLTWYSQFLLRDFAGPSSWDLSNGLQVTYCQ